MLMLLINLNTNKMKKIKIIRPYDTDLNWDLIVYSSKNVAAWTKKPINMRDEEFDSFKRAYPCYLKRGKEERHMFDIIKDANNQLIVLYKNGKILYGAKYKLLPTIKEAIRNAIYYI